MNKLSTIEIKTNLRQVMDIARLQMDEMEALFASAEAGDLSQILAAAVDYCYLQSRNVWAGESVNLFGEEWNAEQRGQRAMEWLHAQDRIIDLALALGYRLLERDYP